MEINITDKRKYFGASCVLFRSQTVMVSLYWFWCCNSSCRRWLPCMHLTLKSAFSNDFAKHCLFLWNRIEILCHDINVHIPHHVSSKIPSYNLRAAHQSLKENWGKVSLYFSILRKIISCWSYLIALRRTCYSCKSYLIK